MTTAERASLADLAAALRRIAKRIDRSIPELGDHITDLLGVADELDLLAVNMRVTYPDQKE